MSRRRARSKRIRDGKARPHAERGQAALRREWSDWVSLAREYHAGVPPPTATPVLLSCAGLAVVSWYFSRLVLFAVAAGDGVAVDVVGVDVAVFAVGGIVDGVVVVLLMLQHWKQPVRRRPSQFYPRHQHHLRLENRHR